MLKLTGANRALSRIFFTFLSILMAATALTVTVPSHVETLHASNNLNGTYFLQARGSQLMVDVEGGNRSNGARVWLWEFNRTPAQQWRFERQSNGAYKIQAVHSGRLLEVRNNSRQNGGQVAQWQDANILTQQWFVNSVGGGYFELVNANSGLALDVTGGRRQMRTHLQQFQRNGTISQHFRLIPVNQTPAPTSFSPVWPTQGGWISQGDFNSRGQRHSTRHARAIDIAVPSGTPVFATEAGTVTAVRNLGNSSFGRYIEIRHDNGAFSLYAHLSSQQVSVGQRVYRGQRIGLSGNTGSSSGPHLHFELSNSTRDRMADFFPGR